MIDPKKDFEKEIGIPAAYYATGGTNKLYIVLKIEPGYITWLEEKYKQLKKLKISESKNDNKLCCVCGINLHHIGEVSSPKGVKNAYYCKVCDSSSIF